MNCQAQANQSSLGDKTEQYIEPNQPQLVQQMETYAAAIGVIDWVGQKMINVH